MKKYKTKISHKQQPISAPKKDNKKVAYWIIFVLIIFWSVGSILGSISFFRGVDNRQVACADEIETSATFQGSDVFFPCTSVYRDTTYSLRPDYSNICSLKFKISTDNNILYFINVEALCIKQVVPLVFYTSDGVNNTLVPADGGKKLTIVPTSSILTPTNTTRYYGGYAANTNSFNNFPNFYCILEPQVQQGFDISTIQQVSFGNRAQRYANPNSDTSGLLVANYVSYIDSTGKELRIYVYAYTDEVNSAWRETISFEQRSYFLTSSVSDDTLYKTGYDAGLEKGKELNANSGYQDGYNTGYRDGESYGYNLGLNASETYSFLSLFSALIDVPLNAFTSLFNFNLLGFNMLNFATAVITLLVVIIILKFIFGGK